jgi:pyridoxine 4-dehydrogenase
MAMSGVYGASDDAESVRTIQAALDGGITLLDTGDFYGSGHNELLIQRALNGRRSDVVLSVKFGALRSPDNQYAGVDTRPVAIRNFLTYSLRRLGTDYIDIYRPARLDPAVPIEDTVGALADLVRAGYIRAIGLSEVGAETIRRAHAVHPIADVQLEYSLMSRAIETSILPTIRALGVSVTAYGILSRGLLSGHVKPAERDIRSARLPRFQGENLTRNVALVEAFTRVAQSLGATPAQAAIAWVASRGTDIVPLLGSKTRDQLREALAPVALGPDAIATIDRAMPPERVAGTRYEAQQMAHLDSERI